MESFGTQLVAGVVLDEDVDVVLDGRLGERRGLGVDDGGDVGVRGVPAGRADELLREMVDQPVPEHYVFHWVTT